MSEAGDHADQPGDGLLDRLLAKHSVDGEEDGGCDGRANRRTQSSEGVHRDEDHRRNRSDHRCRTSHPDWSASCCRYCSR